MYTDFQNIYNCDITNFMQDEMEKDFFEKIIIESDKVEQEKRSEIQEKLVKDK